MYKSIILSPAKEDIREAAQWYNKQQNGLGKRFIMEVRGKVHFIRQTSCCIRANYYKQITLYKKRDSY